MLKLRPLLVAIVVVLVGSAVGVSLTGPGGGAKRTACLAAPERHVTETGRPSDPRYAGPGADNDSGCADRPGHPESFADLARANGSRASRSLAPGTRLRAGAYRAAVASSRDLPVTPGTWTPYGDTPLQGNNTAYDTTQGSTLEGLPGLSGRTTSFARDDSGNIYAATSNGGIWESTDQAATWHSIGDPLPTQVVSGVAWSSAGGGTVLALTGDDAFGGDSIAGLGVYYTRDDGRTWSHSSGVPDGVLGFRLVVDPTDPNKVYAGTGAGLYRSTDGGQSFVNVNLPTGKGATPDCSGKAPAVKDCFLANMVTGLVVEGAKNANTPSAQPGAVMAAVGWRAGDKPNHDGSIQSPGNGIYVSKTGAPGSFTNMDMASHATPVPPFGNDPLTQSRIGRVALGIADGPTQNHQIVYALVQDAVKFNGGLVGLDANENGLTSAAQSDYLNGVWVSTDFGTTWKQLEGSTAFDNDTSSGSALAPPTCKTPAVIGYCPGIQAWYNLWVQPDPTRQTATGVPTRLLLGLEEIWNNNASLAPPTGLDGTTSTKFDVIGRYYGNAACTILNATQNLPVCPADLSNGGKTPTTTTHPDQHGYLFVPDGKGGVTFMAGNDGGVFTQHTDSSAGFSQGGWGSGNNSGLHTLQPYDAEMAKDGTVYMGLQDNGEGKIEPSGKSYTVYGGDGFFTAVDPDHSDTAYEEYTGGDISVTTDGGKTWKDIQPSGMTSALFSTPFQMDPNDPAHLMIGGRQVFETTAGPGTAAGSWTQVFDLGTQKKPGDPSAGSNPNPTVDDGPDNQLSAVDVRGFPVGGNAPTGPKTADKTIPNAGATTIPGGTNPAQNDPIGTGALPDTFPPGTYQDYPLTIGPNDGDASMSADLTWTDGVSDWDMYLYRKDSKGNLTLVANSADGNSPSPVGTGKSAEHFTVPNPQAGDYVVRVVNFAAAGSATLKVTFVQRTSATPLTQSAAYVGYCGYCDIVTQGLPFASGLATNVGGDKPGDALKPDGWHIAKAAGLPQRYITSVRIDPSDPKTVYVTMGGYGRKWALPGALGDDTSKVGTGHVFRSTDAGQTFTDISGDLPDVPANWTVMHGDQLIVGTDLGVFAGSPKTGTDYFQLGTGLPRSPISTLRLKPGDPNLLVAATYGRGVYTFCLAPSVDCPSAQSAAKSAGAAITSASSGSACAAAAAARAANAKPVAARRRVRLTIPASKHAGSVDVFQVSHGRRIFRERLVARYRHRSGPFTWRGVANQPGRHVSDGFYFVRVVGPTGKGPGRVVARIVLQRSHGRWSVHHDYFLRGSCGVLMSAKIERPVFGGHRRYPLRYAYRVGQTASVTVTVRRGRKIVHTFRARRVTHGHTYRITLGLAHLPKGTYTVTTQVRYGGRSVVVNLDSRRI